MGIFPALGVCENLLVPKNIHCIPAKLEVSRFEGHEKRQLFGSQNEKSL
jgi:hypothetical protein